jgi:hypothetical protein
MDSMIIELPQHKRVFSIVKSTKAESANGSEENENKNEAKIGLKNVIPLNVNKFLLKKKLKKISHMSIRGKKMSLGNSHHFNTGRWSSEEHQKFVENLIIHKNNWKKVNYLLNKF